MKYYLVNDYLEHEGFGYSHTVLVYGDEEKFNHNYFLCWDYQVASIDEITGQAICTGDRILECEGLSEIPMEDYQVLAKYKMPFSMDEIMEEGKAIWDSNPNLQKSWDIYEMSRL